MQYEYDEHTPGVVLSAQNKMISNLDPVPDLAVLIMSISDYKQASTGKDVRGLYCTCVHVFTTKI